MESEEELRRAGRATAEFESALEDLVLEGFARGAKIEGEWRIEPLVTGAPNWVVSITKVEPDGEGGYETSLIEE